MVLTTVNHLNAVRVDVQVRTADGGSDTIETTTPHKFCRLPQSLLNGEDPPSASLPAGVEDMAVKSEWWASFNSTIRVRYV